MKKLFLFLIFLVLLSSIVLADSYWNYLTKGFADTLYCKLTGCTMGGDIDMQGHSIYNVTLINGTILTVVIQNVTSIDNLGELIDNDTIIRVNNQTWVWDIVDNGSFQPKINENCSSGYIVEGFYDNGSLICVENINGTSTTIETNHSYNYGNTSDGWKGMLLTTSGVQKIEVINQITEAEQYVTDYWLNTTGNTWKGNVNADNNKLTNLGELIVSKIALTGNLTPNTDDLYYIGNSTHKFHSIFAHFGYFEDVNTTSLAAKDITTSTLSSTNLSSNRITTSNLTSQVGDIANVSSDNVEIGKTFVIMNDSMDLVVVLG